VFIMAADGAPHLVRKIAAITLLVCRKGVRFDAEHLTATSSLVGLPVLRAS
jgi:hypothetical protein